jgi:uncharacterized membrane protein
MQFDVRKKWRRLAGLAAIWMFVMFPIPFLPAWGFNVNPQALPGIMIIAAIVTIPLTLLFIFMK